MKDGAAPRRVIVDDGDVDYMRRTIELAGAPRDIPFYQHYELQLLEALVSRAMRESA